MTVTADRTEDLLETTSEAPDPGSVLDLLQLLEEAVADQRALTAKFTKLSEQRALEVAQARSEVLRQVRARVLRVGVSAADARELLGPFWKDE